ncbi:MAG: hypothetical protein JW944_03130 [Deltaproteobacteria bacterium]|nr:hypothetical protein [Deltaproteobacteria bacterium]
MPGCVPYYETELTEVDPHARSVPLFYPAIVKEDGGNLHATADGLSRHNVLHSFSDGGSFRRPMGRRI